MRIIRDGRVLEAGPPSPEEPAGHIPGEAGLWILIFGDMTIFSLLFGVYIHARSDAPATFDAAQRHLDQNLGAVNTLLLLAASLFVVLGIRAMREHGRPMARTFFTGAVVCAAGFVATKYLEWGQHLGDGFKPATNDFWMFYYVMTGLHLLHVLVGMAALMYLWRQARSARPLAGTRLVVVEGAGCFWHMVDVLWLVLFPLLYLVG